MGEGELKKALFNSKFRDYSEPYEDFIEEEDEEDLV